MISLNTPLPVSCNFEHEIVQTLKTNSIIVTAPPLLTTNMYSQVGDLTT